MCFWYQLSARIVWYPYLKLQVTIIVSQEKISALNDRAKLKENFSAKQFLFEKSFYPLEQSAFSCRNRSITKLVQGMNIQVFKSTAAIAQVQVKPVTFSHTPLLWDVAAKFTK